MGVAPSPWASAALAVGLLACGRVGFTSSGADVGGVVDAGAADGFFVEVSLDGAPLAGGLAEADARCLSALTRRPWLGRDQAADRLDAAGVQAWLCTQATCRDLAPGRRYRYASTVNTTRGGASFVADGAGFLIDDDRAYDDPLVFGGDAGFAEYLTGRGQDNRPQATTCADWTDGSLLTAVAVNDTAYYPERLSKYPRECDASPRLVCLVAPR